jgi:biopolymer transport protein ExbD
MASRGFLIRFIDVGLIVLFGFVMISEIDTVSRVELAAPTEDRPEQETRDALAFSAVEIGADGHFAILDPESGERIRGPIAGIVDLEAELEELSAANRGAGRETVILIRPHPASPVQYTVDVLDACDRLSLRKSLQTETTPTSSGNAAP